MELTGKVYLTVFPGPGGVWSSIQSSEAEHNSVPVHWWLVWSQYREIQTETTHRPPPAWPSSFYQQPLLANEMIQSEAAALKTKKSPSSSSVSHKTQ